ncbi:hypothetical protein Mapa_005743 [Marchantia paleacea]|nr:hypothetical protein Mapa_005743 [Marchantia paleacea]
MDGVSITIHPPLQGCVQVEVITTEEHAFCIVHATDVVVSILCLHSRNASIKKRVEVSSLQAALTGGLLRLQSLLANATE